MLGCSDGGTGVNSILGYMHLVYHPQGEDRPSSAGRNMQ